MQNNDKSVTFVYGGDDFLVDRRSRVLFNAVCCDGGEIFHVDDQHSLLENVRNIVLSLAMVPLFADGCAMWIRGACFFGEKALSEEEKISIASLLDALKSDHGKRVIISALTVDRRTKIFKDFSEFAKNVDLDAEEKHVATEATIEELAGDNGTRIAPPAARLLRMKCGNNTRLLEQEISKLSTYVIGRRSSILEEDVAAMVDDFDVGNFFDPVEKFFSGDIGAVFDSMDRYFFRGSDARPLLSALQSRNRLLIQLRALIEMKRIRIVNNGTSKNDFLNASNALHMCDSAKSTFNIFSQNIWFISKLIPACTKFKFGELLRFQAAFAHAFMEITWRPQEQKNVLKELAVRCLCAADHGVSSQAPEN
ncbi:MAG: hypothetical protein LBB18_02030 [Puniceicoccales bacterium]|jgi:DNA polymerase-3 subunit delta|nr:hypothetical protein [Puniceicoccales bacterium]